MNYFQRKNVDAEELSLAKKDIKSASSWMLKSDIFTLEIR